MIFINLRLWNVLSCPPPIFYHLGNLNGFTLKSLSLVGWRVLRRDYSIFAVLYSICTFKGLILRSNFERLDNQARFYFLSLRYAFLYQRHLVLSILILPIYLRDVFIHQRRSLLPAVLVTSDVSHRDYFLSIERGQVNLLHRRNLFYCCLCPWNIAPCDSSLGLFKFRLFIIRRLILRSQLLFLQLFY